MSFINENTFNRSKRVLVRFSVLLIHFDSRMQGSPKCGIAGGDKIEVGGEIGASRGVRGHQLQILTS